MGILMLNQDIHINTKTAVTGKTLDYKFLEHVLYLQKNPINLSSIWSNFKVAPSSIM